MRGNLVGVMGVLVVVGILLPERADAFVYPIQLGDEIFEVGPVPEKFADKKGLEGASAGFRCQVVGLLWAWIHRWDCQPVVFRARTVIQSAKGEALVAETHSPDDVQLSFWAEHGRWVLLGLFLSWTWGKMLRRQRQQRAFQEAMASLDDD